MFQFELVVALPTAWQKAAHSGRAT